MTNPTGGYDATYNFNFTITDITPPMPEPGWTFGFTDLVFNASNI